MPRRSRVWKALLVILSLLLLSAVLLVAMTGLVPGLSRVVGAAEPRDLGVTATAADYDRVVEEVGFLFKQAPAAAGPQRIDREFTEAELTALLAHTELSGAQVRIGADETMEISLSVSKRSLPAELVQYLPRATPDVLPLYVKGRLAAVGPSEVQLTVERLEVGRLPLPLSLLGPDGQAGLTSAINEQLRSIPGLVLEGLSFRDGALRVQGTYQP